jgi:lipoyl(octanoyl) transferase
MPLFNVIDLFLDETGRDGPEQMALDQALLERARRPLLRSYRWAGPAISFGYSQSVARVKDQCPSLPCVRRWTGGGVVWHDGDWTFALIVPSSQPLAEARPADAYRSIHAHVMAALNRLGYSARLAGPAECAAGNLCFAAPALHDVIGLDRRKLCGGAQRRTRSGFLHQGSIQNLRPPRDFAIRLLELMAVETRPFSPEPATVVRMRELAAHKYGTTAWLKRIA